MRPFTDADHDVAAALQQLLAMYADQPTFKTLITSVGRAAETKLSELRLSLRWYRDGDEAAWLSATGSCLTDPAIGEAGDMDCTAVTIRTQKGRLCQINTTRRAAYGYDDNGQLLTCI